MTQSAVARLTTTSANWLSNTESGERARVDTAEVDFLGAARVGSLNGTVVLVDWYQARILAGAVQQANRTRTRVVGLKGKRLPALSAVDRQAGLGSVTVTSGEGMGTPFGSR